MPTRDEELDALRKENDVLRGLLPALNAPCPYCGLTNMAKCTLGFPGCSYADDLLCGEETVGRSVLERLHALERRKPVPPGAGEARVYTVAGIEVRLSYMEQLQIRLNDGITQECYTSGEFDRAGRYGLRIYARHSLVASIPPTFLTQAQAREWGETFINTVRQ